DEVSPSAAALVGAARVIGQELAGVRSQIVDLPMDGPFEPLRADLADELWHGSEAFQIGIRHGGRWIADYEHVALDPSASAHRLRRQGVYVITGGPGAVGFTLGHHLAQRLQARLVLVARSPMPPRSEWDQWLETHPAA